MAGAFRHKIWDPSLIISQILALQALYYIGIGGWLVFINFFTGHHNSLENIFKYEEIQFKEIQGRAIMIAFLLNSLISSLGLWKIVQRSKQCLDFTITTHILHLLGCWIYNGRPSAQPSVWLLHLVATILMCVLGEYLCLKTEINDIPLLNSRVDL